LLGVLVPVRKKVAAPGSREETRTKTVVHGSSEARTNKKGGHIQMEVKARRAALAVLLPLLTAAVGTAQSNTVLGIKIGIVKKMNAKIGKSGRKAKIGRQTRNGKIGSIGRLLTRSTSRIPGKAVLALVAVLQDMREVVARTLGLRLQVKISRRKKNPKSLAVMPTLLSHR